MNKNHREKIIHSVVEKLKEKKEVLGILLFGSYIKGEYSPKHSDIDMYIVVDKNFDIDTTEGFQNASMYEASLYNDLNKTMQGLNFHLVFGYNQLSSRGKLLRFNIMKEGKVVYMKKANVFQTIDDVGAKVYYLYDLNFKNAKPYEVSNFKRSIKSKFMGEVIYTKGSMALVDEENSDDFIELCHSKNISYTMIKEFISNVNKGYE